MPYMREFFKEKLHLPVEFFNPLQNVTVSESAPMLDVTRSAHLLGELVGLALRSANAWRRLAFSSLWLAGRLTTRARPR